MRLTLVALALAIILPFSACSRKSSGNLNVLNLYTSAKIKGFDPAISEDTYSNAEVLRVYEPLFQYHPFKRPYVLDPLLAESMPSVSKDGLTYKFKIRKGVSFIDDAAFPGGKGREVNAEDVVYSQIGRAHV